MPNLCTLLDVSYIFAYLDDLESRRSRSNRIEQCNDGFIILTDTLSVHSLEYIFNPQNIYTF